MKIQPIMKVQGIKLELTLEEALLVINDVVKYREKVVGEISAVLNGMGVDPKTGELKPSALLSESGLVPGEKGGVNISNLKTKPCKYCGHMYSIGRGLKLHESQCTRKKKAGKKRKPRAKTAKCQYCRLLFVPQGLSVHEKHCRMKPEGITEEDASKLSGEII